MSTCGIVTSVTSGVWKIEKMFTLQIKQIAVNKTDKNVQTYGKIVQNSCLDPDSVRFLHQIGRIFHLSKISFATFAVEYSNQFLTKKREMNLVPHFITACAVALTVTACTKGTYQAPDAPVKEVAFTQVHIDDKFWAPRIETNRLVSIPSAFKECEKNGRFDNFAIAGGLMKGEHRGDFSFDDTDPYKIIEGASY